MRHGDINLTLNRYTHTLKGQKSDALSRLPDLSLPSRERQRNIATGTDGKSDSAKSPAIDSGQQRITMDTSGQQGRDNDSKNADLGVERWPSGLRQRFAKPS